MTALTYPPVTLLQEGTSEEDWFSAAAALEGGSAILVGYTFGSWNAENIGGGNTSDFAAVILDADGIVKWRWQVRGASRVFVKVSLAGVEGDFITRFG